MIDLFSWLGPQEWLAVRLSIKVAFWAMIVSLPFGVFVAFALARWRFPGKQLLNGLVHLPLILPPVVTGYILLVLFGPLGPVGRVLEPYGLGIAFRWTGASLAAGIMGFPLLVRSLRLSFELIDPGLERAAATLGASPVWVFLSVSLPLALPGLIAGAVLAFAKAMGEFGATITFVANIPGETQTLPSAIYALLQVPGGENSALRLVVISILVSFGALLLSEALNRRLAARLMRT
ncbi:molybdate ABC transporter permease subunit [Tritonibacter horizontis]|uniref:Molybdenum transport system permease n=1 Tax=Tritonibacter horizontis TaxID=1768241 RepID=A0A132BU84_9RHOB|nr:molybdate ABC transporter permease subunit [Tritonibacter horizontis]KUP91939.1 molybdenum transport system permease protein ModB [Tritonibacter horizontis]